MMSVPAINSVMPPSGSQPAKINSSPTANPPVSPIGLSVSPKISVIPPSQIQASPTKTQIGVNHSSLPLSLVFENKVSGSQTQLAKPSAEKPKDLSPSKPTSNGMETSSVKTPPHAQPPTSKSEEITEQTTNHSEERMPPAELKNEGPPQQVNEKPPEKVETNAADPKETKPDLDAKAKEDSKVEKTEEKNKPQANKRKREQKPQEQKSEEPEPEKKTKRIRSQVLPYQSPLPELATFLNKSLKEKDSSHKTSEEKLIVFYKNEFLAVRNAEGGFYLCQTLQNVNRSSHRIRIRWLSQNKESSTDDGDAYAPDFYDMTDFECILTTVALSKMDKNMYKLPKVELERIENILKRALDVEKGVAEKPSITVEHPDGIDLSLYKDESQLQKPKKAAKRKASSPTRKSPKQAKKSQVENVEEKPPSTKTPKSKSRSKAAKKGVKTSSGKSKSGKRGSTRSESKTKAMDQLKVSPPNEKARVVAKVLRKVDIVPAKEPPPKKPTKSKASKRSVETPKVEKKKGQKSAKKKSQDTVKEEVTPSHHERRQGKSKSSNTSNTKNKKN